MTQDLYSILGVTPAAEPAEVRAAYRSLMRKFHPDADSSGQAAERAREINAAYAILSSPERRAAYDGSIAEHRKISFEPVAVHAVSVPRRSRLGAIAAIVIAVVAAGMIAFAIAPPARLPFSSEGRPVVAPRRELASATEAAQKPASYCADPALRDVIKRELFRRAANRRPEAAPQLREVEPFASARVSANDSRSGSCTGWLTLDVPPTVAVDGGRTNLNADVAFDLTRPRGVLVLTHLSGVERVVRSLSTLAPAPKEPAPHGTKDAREVAVSLPPPPMKSSVAARKLAGASRPAATDSCAGEKNRTDRLICADSNLSSLDRQLASFYRQSWTQADDAKRTALLRTRQEFNGRRDACASSGCMTTAYVSRLREISDIMSGKTRP